MKPTKILKDEHRVIEVGLECLTRLTERAENDGKLDSQMAEDTLDFIRNFADRCHHGKEEDRLFVAMMEKGIPKEGGPIGVMLEEHVQGRAFVAGMSDNVAGAALGDSAALAQFAANARGYVELLKSHIAKEDNVLFPMADQVLSESEQGELLAKFKESEVDFLAGGDPEHYFKVVTTLAGKLGVSTAPIERATDACGRFI